MTGRKAVKEGSDGGGGGVKGKEKPGELLPGLGVKMIVRHSPFWGNLFHAPASRTTRRDWQSEMSISTP